MSVFSLRKVLFATGLLGCAAFAQADETENYGIEHVMSDSAFGAVVERLENTLDEKGLTLMTTVDHAANAANIDMTLAPTTLFIFGNPKVGTPMMQCHGSVGMDLPQKMLVRETDEGVRIEWNDPHFLAQRHGLENCDLPLDKVSGLLRTVAETAAEE
ncbi:DUF302 domain-containing protein [Halomonas sp. LS-001]